MHASTKKEYITFNQVFKNAPRGVISIDYRLYDVPTDLSSGVMQITSTDPGINS